MNIIRVECPECRQAIELPDTTTGLIQCPNCQVLFTPKNESPQAVVRDNATLMRTLSGVCFFLFLIAAGVALYAAAMPDGLHGSFIAATIAGGLLSLGIGLQIIAQLLFIRAALESKP